MMNYTWLLFDADGTLFDYDAAESKALAAAFAEAGFPYSAHSVATYRAINDRAWAAFERGELTQPQLHLLRFQQTLAALGLQADAKTFADSYLTHLSRAADLIEGALDVVRHLAGKHALYLITNGIPRVQHGRLARSPLGPYFQGMVISGEVGSAKPHAPIFDAAFEGMGSPAKEEVLIIGDSLSSDIRGGVRYGIDTCWYNPGGRPAPQDLPITYTIQSLDELANL